MRLAMMLTHKRCDVDAAPWQAAYRRRYRCNRAIRLILVAVSAGAIGFFAGLMTVMS